jgi:hypothetical protein
VVRGRRRARPKRVDGNAAGAGRRRVRVGRLPRAFEAAAPAQPAGGMDRDRQPVQPARGVPALRRLRPRVGASLSIPPHRRGPRLGASPRSRGRDAPPVRRSVAAGTRAGSAPGRHHGRAPRRRRGAAVPAELGLRPLDGLRGRGDLRVLGGRAAEGRARAVWPPRGRAGPGRPPAGARAASRFAGRGVRDGPRRGPRRDAARVPEESGGPPRRRSAPIGRPGGGAGCTRLRSSIPCPRPRARSSEGRSTSSRCPSAATPSPFTTPRSGRATSGRRAARRTGRSSTSGTGTAR